MNRSLVVVALAATVLGLAACKPTENTSAPTTTTSPSVVTEVVTETVTNPPKPDSKDDRPGYGALKLGMKWDEAKATGLAGDLKPFNGAACVWNDKLEISQKNGVESIELPRDAKTSAGIGIGSTFADVKKAYPNLAEVGAVYASKLPGGTTGIAFYRLNAKPFQDTDKVSGIRIYAVEGVCPHRELGWTTTTWGRQK